MRGILGLAALAFLAVAAVLSRGRPAAREPVGGREFVSAPSADSEAASPVADGSPNALAAAVAKAPFRADRVRPGLRYRPESNGPESVAEDSVVLRGVAWGAMPAAVLQLGADGETLVASVGDSVAGFRVAEIGPTSVRLVGASGSRRLTLERNGSS